MNRSTWEAPHFAALPIRETARGPSNGLDQMASSEGTTVVAAAPKIAGASREPRRRHRPRRRGRREIGTLPT